MDPLSIIASTIAIVGVVASSSKAIQHIKGLPSEFLEVNRNLPLVQDTLVLARDRLKDDGSSLDESSKEAIEPVLSGCETKAKMLQEIFDKVEKGAKEGGSGLDLYRSALLRLGKAHRVETLLQGIIKSLDLLATNHFFRSAIQRGKLVDAEYELSCLKSSVPDSEFEGSGNVQNIAAGATGQQTNISGQGHYVSSGSGKQFNAHIMNFISTIKGERPPFDLSRLHTSPYLERKNSVADRVPGTCEWFVGHKHFLTWRESTTSSLLWVSANPGCGKTVLSKHLVEHELQTTQTRITCYFFFKEDFEDQRSAKSAISCILHQLFTQKEKLLSQKVRKRFDTHATHLASSFDELWEILVMIAQDNAGTEFVCVLDALDECEEQDRNALAQALRRFYGSSNNTNLKFLVTGRPLEHVTSIFQDLTASSMPVIHLEGEAPEELEMIAQEIKIYTRHRVRQIKQNLQLDAGEEILLLRQLQSVPNQTYLWLYLTLRSIEDDLTITKDKIREIASALPRSVNDAYEKMLSQSHDPVNTRKLLHLVVGAFRPLTLVEMDFALAIRPHHKSFKALGERPPPERLKKHILSLCGHFVTITDSRIYLLHQTAKEFLVAKVEKPSGSRLVWEASLRPQESHEILSQICMQPLFFADLATLSKANDQDNMGGQAADSVFLDYALDNWAMHTRLAESQDPKVFELLRRLFPTGPGACPTYFGIYMSQPQQVNRPEKLTTLMWASAFGLDRFVKHLLEAGRAEVSFKDSFGRTALHYASENGHDGVVRELLKGPKFRLTEVQSWKRAKIDTRDKYGRTPLMAAAVNGHEAVLRRLMDNGANVVKTLDSGMTALGFAVDKGHEKCVRLILQRSAVNELRAEYGRLALCCAVASCSEGITRLLLEAGVDVNAAGPDGFTPLMMACRQEWRSAAVVSILLEAKADMEARGPLRRTALHYALESIPETTDEASLKGQEVIVQMLLMAGAREDAKDLTGTTPRMLRERSLRKRPPGSFQSANDSKERRTRFARYRCTTLGYYVATVTAALIILSAALFRHRWLALLPSLEEGQLRDTILIAVWEVGTLVLYIITAGVLFIGMIIHSTRPKRTTAHHNTFLVSSYYYPLLSIIGPSILVATLVVYGF